MVRIKRRETETENTAERTSLRSERVNRDRHVLSVRSSRQAKQAGQATGEDEERRDQQMAGRGEAVARMDRCRMTQNEG